MTEQVFKDLVWNPGVKALEIQLDTAIPILNIPVVHQLEEGLIEMVGNLIFSTLVMVVDVEAIRLVNDEHQAAYTDAALKLRVIGHDKGIDSDEFKKARDDAKADLSRFTEFSG